MISNWDEMGDSKMWFITNKYYFNKYLKTFTAYGENDVSQGPKQSDYSFRFYSQNTAKPLTSCSNTTTNHWINTRSQSTCRRCPDCNKKTKQIVYYNDAPHILILEYPFRRW